MGGDTALVLGGGGLTGIGWECGILYGLARAGVDLTAADLVVGTSAGSVVGAQLTSGRLSVQELYERQLGDATGEHAAKLGAGVIARYAVAMARSRNATAYRRMGRRHGTGRRHRGGGAAARGAGGPAGLARMAGAPVRGHRRGRAHR